MQCFSKLLLIAAPFLLAFQFVVTAKRGEPYPAVLMPAFNGPPPATWPVFVLTSGDETREVTPDELFADWPRPNRFSVPYAYLTGEPSAEVAAWLLERARRLDPNALAVSVRWVE